MTRYRAIDIIKNEIECVNRQDTCEHKCADCELVLPDIEIFEAYDMAIQALSQEPCENVVSRQDALKTMCEFCPVYNCTSKCSSYEHMTLLPSVTQKSGKWNEYYTSQKGNDVFNCKECGHTFVVTQGKDNMNYCPNCGAKMVEPQEQEGSDKE